MQLNEPELLWLRVSTLNAAALITTGLCIYISFLYRKKGLLLSRLKEHVETSGAIWPYDAVESYLLNNWQIQLGLIQVVALIGLVSTLVYRSDYMVTLWFIFTLLSYGLLHSKIPNIVKMRDILLDRCNKFAPEARGKIIYADEELILKEKVFIRRCSTYQIVYYYSDLESYGFLPANRVFFHFRNSKPFIATSRDAKTTIKLLRNQLAKNKISVQIASSKTINAFQKEQDRLNYGIAISLLTAGVSFCVLFFFWTGIKLGLPMLKLL
ncbi:MAG: hypothetical protein ACTSVM_06525 [Candidatus Ranarchaeia archaeon]